MADAAEKQSEPLDAMTVDEAAALLKLNRKTIYEAIKNGEAPWAKKVGKTIRISRSALTKWFESDNQQTTPARSTKRDGLRRQGK